MAPSLFILSITLYLVSMVGALVAAFLSKQIPTRLTHTLIIFHFLVFLFWFLLRDSSHTVANPGNSNYLFMVWFCSGILAAGMILRMTYPLLMKVYFALFLLSLAVFIAAPARLLGFIASGNFNSVSPARFHITDTWFLVEQQGSSGLHGTPDSLPFKIVKEMGVFHKTTGRGILLPVTTDSVKLLSEQVSDSFQLRIYYSVNASTDSLDRIIVTDKQDNRRNTIEQRRQ